MPYLQGACSYRRAEEEQDIKRRSTACSQYPPCLADEAIAILVEIVEQFLHRLALHVRLG